MEGTWVKSSYSSGADNCVEVWLARAMVRDSKAPDSGELDFSGGGWSVFRAAVKAGQYDR